MIVDLPVELSGEIVGRWLRVVEIVRLDTAFCQTVGRECLHRSVLKSSSCIVNNVSNFCADNVLDWIASRGIRVEHVSVRGHNNLISEEYLQLYGKHITSICWRSYYPGMDASMTLIPRYCGNLLCVEYSCGSVCNSFLQLLNACPRLESLKVQLSYGMKDSNFTAQLKSNFLRLHSLDLGCNEAATQRILSMCVPESVQRLRIAHDACVSQWSRFTTLRSLDLSVCTPTRHTLVQILDQCRSIVNLKVSQEEISDSEHGEHMPPLRSLNIENGYANGAHQLLCFAFVQRQKHTLEALYACGCDGLSGATINPVMAECRNLRTLSIDCGQVVDYSLMGSLTTLIMDFVEDDTWSLIQQHCRSCKYLHVIFGYVPVQDLAVMVKALSEMPSLRELCFADVPEGFKPICAEAADKLRVLRPTLYIEENEEEGAWYDLFKLPI